MFREKEKESQTWESSEQKYKFEKTIFLEKKIGKLFFLKNKIRNLYFLVFFLSLIITVFGYLLYVCVNL